METMDVNGSKTRARLRRLALAPLVLLAFSAACQAASRSIPILVVHSYSQEYPWTHGQHQGFVDELGSDKSFHYDIKVEYLDTKRAPYTPEYAEATLDYFRRKYLGYGPRAVYVTDDNALGFALSHLGRLFPETPFFFSGVNDYGIRSRLDPTRFTGVFERKEIQPNLELMHLLDPSVRQILVVGDTTETYRAIESDIRLELEQQWKTRASFISSNRIEEMTELLHERNEKFLFLTTLGSVRDEQDRVMTLQETIGAITGAGSFTVVSMEDAYLYPGVLGGYVTSGPHQGRAAADLLKRHLRGQPIGELPPMEESPNRYIFDEQLLRLTGARLPDTISARATLINPVPSFYDVHRTSILAALVGLAVLLLLGLIGFLAFVIAKNRQVERVSAEVTRVRDSLDRAQSLARIGSWDWEVGSDRWYWSTGIYALFGAPPDQFGKGHQSVLRFVHPDDRERLDRALDQVRQWGSPLSIGYRIARPDGEIRDISENIEVLSSDSGRRMLGTMQDVTAQVQSERDLIEARDEAERASQTKSEFLSRMSHELRTPMNAILGFAQLLECGDLDDTQRDEVEEILKAGRHLLDLINEVLDLAKIESDHIELRPEPIALAPLIEECMSLIGSLAQKRGIRLGSGRSEAVVRADPIRLKQALLNLLSNAIKYNREGGSVRIDTRISNDGHLRISIIDTGIGIAQEKLGELFQPFNRLDADSRGIEGTGIGLALTRRIIDLMGGQIGVETEVGRGSRFWIDLPLDSLEAPRATMVAASPTAESTISSSNRYTLLYIEDDPANLKLVRQILALRLDIQLLSAHTSELGIELAQTRKPDIIMLDTDLPGTDTREVLDSLRSDPRSAGTPVVAITSDATPGEKQRGRSAGFSAFLTRPIDVSEFLATVEDCLAKYDDPQDHAAPEAALRGQR